MHVGIVGAGISGISAAYSLHNHHKVTLIDARDEIGGHANSVLTLDVSEREVNVDTGFIVYNDKNYPNFSNFIRDLGIETSHSDMSFSYTNVHDGSGYAGTLAGLFPSIKAMQSLRHGKFLWNIYKFSALLGKRASCYDNIDISIVDALADLGCPDDVIRKYFVAVASAIWSCDRDDALNIPASVFVDFFSNHGLLGISHRPKWFSITGGSRKYLEEFSKRFSGRILTATDVKFITLADDSVSIRSNNGPEMKFDMVIVATHSDQALQIVEDLPPEMRCILSAYRYSRNEVVLHTDTTLMPKNRRLWASWNVLSYRDDGVQTGTSITYNMNRLQRLETSSEFLVTLNPRLRPDEGKTIFATTYSHPILRYDVDANEANFRALNHTTERIRFCGAYLGYGFHEDGFTSGKRVAATVNNFARYAI